MTKREFTQKTQMLIFFAKIALGNRYNGSVLGLLWVLIKPYLTFAVLLIIWTSHLSKSIDNFQLYLLIGLVFYNFWRDMILSGTNSLIEMSNITLKVDLPRQIVLLSNIIDSLITYIVNLLLIFVLIFAFGVQVTWLGILNFIILTLGVVIFSMAVAMPLSVINVRFRDLKNILDLGLFIIFWLTPVMYDLEGNFLTQEAKDIVQLSPITSVINQVRASLGIYANIDLKVGVILLVLSVIMIIPVWKKFNKWSRGVAELY